MYGETKGIFRKTKVKLVERLANKPVICLYKYIYLQRQTTRRKLIFGS